jgi:hypothetical protein
MKLSNTKYGVASRGADAGTASVYTCRRGFSSLACRYL